MYTEVTPKRRDLDVTNNRLQCSGDEQAAYSISMNQSGRRGVKKKVLLT